MFARKIESWSIPDFLAGRHKKRRATGVYTLQSALAVGTLAATMTLLGADTDVFAAVAEHTAHPISPVFDKKIWPLFLDIGGPLAKTMMAIGIYRCIRNDVDRGWKMTYRAGIGLVGLYAIDGTVKILEGIGNGLESI